MTAKDKARKVYNEEHDLSPLAHERTAMVKRNGHWECTECSYTRRLLSKREERNRQPYCFGLMTFQSLGSFVFTAEELDLD